MNHPLEMSGPINQRPASMLSDLPGEVVVIHSQIAQSSDMSALWNLIHSDLTSRLRSKLSHCSEPLLRWVLLGMNYFRWDVANRFCYCQSLGGLGHVRLSCQEQVPAWILLPTDHRHIGPYRPIDRMGLCCQGLCFTKAPELAAAAWSRCPVPRKLHLLHGDNDTLFDEMRCAGCRIRKVQLKHCQCNLVRYCSVQCQTQHWPEHRPLCKWVDKCCNPNAEL